MEYEVFQSERDVVTRLNYWDSQGVEVENYFIQIVPKIDGTYVMFHNVPDIYC